MAVGLASVTPVACDLYTALDASLIVLCIGPSTVWVDTLLRWLLASDPMLDSSSLRRVPWPNRLKQERSTSRKEP